MTILDAIILGLVQGLTEFLPISSSGHLVIFAQILQNTDQTVVFEIAVHLGTLGAIFIYYWQDIWKLIAAIPAIPAVIAKKETSSEQRPYVFMHLYLIIATIPAVFVGLFFDDMIENAFASPVFACVMLLVTGGILWTTRWAPTETKPLSGIKALLVGLSQALAIMPGISRSGTTITAALHLGIEKEKCAEFSFLMAIPAILGAAVLYSFKIPADELASLNWLPIIVGAAVAFVSGYVAILVLLKVLKKGEFQYFAIYCWVVGAIGLFMFM